MKEISKGWKRPGMRSGDYGKYRDHDHDRRSYATAQVSHNGKGPKGYGRSDVLIYDEVCEALKWSPDVDASEIEVSVQQGVVSLNGFVDSRHSKKLAEKICDRISGVQDVENLLIIKKDFDLEEDKIVARGDNGLFTQEIVQK